MNGLFLLLLTMIFCSGCWEDSSHWWGYSDSSKYTIFEGHYDQDKPQSFIPPILLDKSTGQTWRYFRSIDKDGSTLSEGWQPLLFMFPDSTAFADTPSIAYRNYFHADIKNGKSMKQFLGHESIIDDIRYFIYDQQNKK